MLHLQLHLAAAIVSLYGILSMRRLSQTCIYCLAAAKPPIYTARPCKAPLQF